MLVYFLAHKSVYLCTQMFHVLGCEEFDKADKLNLILKPKFTGIPAKQFRSSALALEIWSIPKYFGAASDCKGFNQYRNTGRVRNVKT